MTRASALLNALPTDRYLSEAAVIRLTGMNYRRVISASQPLKDLGLVDIATVQHAGLKPMRIYRRVA